MALQQGELALVYNGLFLAGLFGDPETLSFLKSFKSLISSNSPPEVRERAANVLTNHANSVSPSFWRHLDLAHDPFLLPAVVIGLSEHAPDEAIAIAGKAAHGIASGTLLYPIRLAVQKLLATDVGRLRLLTVLKDASEALAKLLHFVIESEGVILVDQPVLSPAEQFAKQMDLPPESAVGFEPTIY